MFFIHKTFYYIEIRYRNVSDSIQFDFRLLPKSLPLITPVEDLYHEILKPNHLIDNNQ